MKYYQVLLLVATVFWGTSTIQGQTGEGDAFKFTDGYFLGSLEPVHLVHDGAKPEVRLGDKYNLRLNFQANPEAVNPCSRREEKPCRFVQQIVIKHDDGSEEFITGWKEGLEFRTDDSVGFGLSDITIPRTAPTGDAVLVVKMIKDNEVVFKKEWPIKIW